MTGRIVVDGRPRSNDWRTRPVGTRRRGTACVCGPTRRDRPPAMRFNDPRRFGHISLDPEPVELSGSTSSPMTAVGARMRARPTPYRRQGGAPRPAVVAGLGNLCVDEVLWWAGIAPRSTGDDVDGRRSSPADRGDAPSLPGDVAPRRQHDRRDRPALRPSFPDRPRDGAPLRAVGSASGPPCGVRRISGDPGIRGEPGRTWHNRRRCECSIPHVVDREPFRTSRGGRRRRYQPARVRDGVRADRHRCRADRRRRGGVPPDPGRPGCARTTRTDGEPKWRKGDPESVATCSTRCDRRERRRCRRPTRTSPRSASPPPVIESDSAVPHETTFVAGPEVRAGRTRRRARAGRRRRAGRGSRAGRRRAVERRAGRRAEPSDGNPPPKSRGAGGTGRNPYAAGDGGTNPRRAVDPTESLQPVRRRTTASECPSAADDVTAAPE